MDAVGGCCALARAGMRIYNQGACCGGVGHEYHGKWQTLKRSDLQSYTCKCGYPFRNCLFAALLVIRHVLKIPRKGSTIVPCLALHCLFAFIWRLLLSLSVA